MENRPRVLIFSLAYLPFVGGAELALKEITDRFSGFEFTMVTANLDGKQAPVEKIGPITIHRIGRGRLGKYLFPWAALRYAERLHQQHHFTAIWSMMANQAGLAAYWFKRRHQKLPYLLTLQEGDSLKKIWSRTWWMRPWYKAMYRRADLIQAISNFLADRARKLGYRGKLTIIPNGVDLASFSASGAADQQERLRTELGLLADDQVVITISRLVEKNAVDTIVKSLPGLDVKLLIIGTGVHESKLRSLALELGVNTKVLFLGHIPYQQLPGYLRLADVFVRPSRSEGLGNAFIEAMAAGVPVVATKVGCIPDFLRPGENGLFCEVNNPRDLGEQVNRLLIDEALRTKVIAGGKQTAAKYDWSSVAVQMESLLHELVS